MPEDNIMFRDTRMATLVENRSVFDEETDELDIFTGDKLTARILKVRYHINSLQDACLKMGIIIDSIVGYPRTLKENLDSITKKWEISSYSMSVSAPGESISHSHSSHGIVRRKG